MLILNTLVFIKQLLLLQNLQFLSQKKISLIFVIHIVVIVTDNATSFTSEEFQQWCKNKGIIHFTGALYRPATNGAAERLIQTYEKSLKKSLLSPRASLNEFLIQYRHTPLDNFYSPSELLNGHQIRTLIDVLLHSPPHIIQSKQPSNNLDNKNIEKEFKVGSPCYALYFGPRRDRKGR